MKQKIYFDIKEGRTVRQVLENNGVSSALLSKLKNTDDGITVCGERRFSDYVLKSGDVLCINIVESGSVNIEPVRMPLDIIYEDEYLLCVNKPHGMAVHVSHGNMHSALSNGIIEYLERDGQEYTFHAVTRLDKNTSGIVVIAKNAYIHGVLSRQLRDKSFYKEYYALVEGLTDEKGIINAPIAREKESIIVRCVREDGDEAITEYETAEYRNRYSLVRVFPKTGRTHQIRVHFSYIGHPLVGDDLYGGEKIAENRHLLHCKKVAFIHPITHKKLEIETEIPDFFSMCADNNFRS